MQTKHIELFLDFLEAFTGPLHVDRDAMPCIHEVSERRIKGDVSEELIRLFMP